MAAAPTLIEVYERTRVRVKAVFSAAGAPHIPMDPTIVKLIVREPGAASPTTYTFGQPGSPIVRDLAGLYSAFLILNDHGSWWFTWAGEGSTGPQAVGEGVIRVKNAVNI